MAAQGILQIHSSASGKRYEAPMLKALKAIVSSISTETKQFQMVTHLVALRIVLPPHPCFLVLYKLQYILYVAIECTADCIKSRETNCLCLIIF